MAETLGSLCDKLTIVDLKIWHSRDAARLASLRKQKTGLQAEINAIINDDWGHFKANEPISSPRMTADALVAKMNDAMSRGEVPLLDVEVYQDGTISPETLRLFQEIRREVKRRRPGSLE